MKIYLQKEEAILERYGDEEAALYEQMIQMEKEMAKNQPPPKQHKKYDRDNRDNTSKQDAEKMGFNFSKNGPPRFKNDKKKEQPAAEVDS